MSPRASVPAGTLTAMEAPSSTAVHLYEFYRRSVVPTGSLQLVRITDGLVEDVLTSSLSDLADWTELAGVGNWSLTGGKIRYTPAGFGTGMLRYDNVTSTIGRIVQVLADPRSTGEPFWGAATAVDPAASAHTDAEVMIERTVTFNGSTAGGIENQDTKLLVYDPSNPFHVCPIYVCPPINGADVAVSEYARDFSQHLDHPVLIAANGPRTGGLEGYTHRAGGGPMGFGFLKNTGVTTIDDGCPALWARNQWELDEAGCPTAPCPQPGFQHTIGPLPWSYASGNIEFTRLSVYRGWDIKIVSLPPGYAGKITGGVSPTFGGDTGGTVSGVAGVSTMDPWGDMYPYTTIELYIAGTTTLVASATPADGLWGGDVWELQQSSTVVETPEFHITDASGDIDWAGQIYEAIGGEIAWSGLNESDDTRGQGVTVSLPNVDQSKVYERLWGGQHVGLRCRVWRCHYDEENGVRADSPVVLHDGALLSGFRVAEESTVPEDG